MGKLDFAAINAAALQNFEALLRDWFPNGSLQGNEFRIGNLRGDAGDSLSINVVTGVWMDFASSDKGSDPISLYAARERLTQGKAAAELAIRLGTGRISEPSDDAPRGKPNARRVPIMPIPSHAGPLPTEKPIPPDEEHPDWRRFPIVAKWLYRDALGRPLGYVCRLQRPNGDKEVVPLTWARDAKGNEQWSWLSFPKPRPLYGLDRLANKPGTQVVIVEGEKCADAAERLFPNQVAISWPGGSQAVGHAEWAPLRGRRVLIWPDADDPGYKAAVEIAQQLDGIAAAVRIYCPDNRAKGWDCADAEAEGWTAKTAIQEIRTSLFMVEDFAARKGVQVRAVRARAVGESRTVQSGGSQQVMGDPNKAAPFTPLGFDHGVYFYLSHATKQVIPLTMSAHTKTTLVALTPIQFWETYFPGLRAAPNWDQAINWMYRKCEKAGVYDPSRIHGRGAWWDDGRPVLHLGHRIIVDGQIREIEDHRSRYVYEAAATLREPDLANPMSNLQGEKLIDLCKRLPWEREISAYLMAGWIAIAPIGGALRWRPHLWITGAAGTGKSWVLEQIVAPALGGFALVVQSDTSEAGLRQTLGADSLPVVFDEAEAVDAKKQANMQNVMGLMRAASASTSAGILKGGSNGRSVFYKIQSMFAFASINVNAKQLADKTRITVLAMTPDSKLDDDERALIFKRTKEAVAELISDDFARRLVGRSIKMVRTIRKNAETFAIAGAKVIGTRRIGDQLGALLAGAYSLHSEQEISEADAETWLRERDWTEEDELKEERDELICLQRIVETQIRVATGSQTTDRTIGELAKIVHAEVDDAPAAIPVAVAKEVLLRHGVRIERRQMIVSNTHNAIARVLSNTPWAQQWGRILKRIVGAESVAPRRFGTGPAQRSVGVPLETILDI